VKSRRSIERCSVRHGQGPAPPRSRSSRSSREAEGCPENGQGAEGKGEEGGAQEGGTQEGDAQRAQK
jgi:hypothetical protein